MGADDKTPWPYDHLLEEMLETALDASTEQEANLAVQCFGYAALSCMRYGATKEEYLHAASVQWDHAEDLRDKAAGAA